MRQTANEADGLTQNEVIAIFMGLSECKCGLLPRHYQTGPMAWQIVSIENMKYHNSWDSLMPVVKKITPMARELNQVAWSDVKYDLLDGSIELVYHRVVNFIDWYNNWKDRRSKQIGNEKKA